MPAHGTLLWLDSASNTAVMQENIRQGGFGQLRISVPPGPRSYYVKLKELRPRRGEVLGAFIGAGRTLTIEVPLDGYGTTIYDLHYGSGSTWYGREYTFGPQGSYAAAEKTFAFEEGSGWEVQLIARPGGNLGTSGLGYGNF